MCSLRQPASAEISLQMSSMSSSLANQGGGTAWADPQGCRAGAGGVCRAGMLQGVILDGSFLAGVPLCRAPHQTPAGRGTPAHMSSRSMTLIASCCPVWESTLRGGARSGGVACPLRWRGGIQAPDPLRRAPRKQRAAWGQLRHSAYIRRGRRSGTPAVNVAIGPTPDALQALDAVGVRLHWLPRCQRARAPHATPYGTLQAERRASSSAQPRLGPFGHSSTLCGVSSPTTHVQARLGALLRA